MMIQLMRPMIGLGVVAGLAAGASACVGAPTPTLKAALVAEAGAAPTSPHPAITRLIEGQVFGALSPEHQQMIANIAAQDPKTRFPMSACFAEGTDEATMHAFSAAVFGLNDGFGSRYQTGGRWSSTASGSGGTTGSQITLTWSFVPDGTSIPGGAGEATAPSELFARMNTIYGGNTAQWQALYQSVFDRWGDLCGITYVYEPNDDGAAFPGSAGQLGVRGDCRMAGHPIDGNSGILAFNYFPNTGDMVIDTADSFFATTSSNSLRLRNVLSHEHGHGMGMSHVCPIQQTKLMEPFVSTAYDGPRHDDVRHAQRLYGDINEPDNSAAQATNVGTIAPGAPQTFGAVPAPTVALGSTLSIDGDGESDWFKFSVTGAGGVSVTVTPIGQSYDDSAQACSGESGSCCSGNIIDSLAMANLAVQVIGSNGSTVLGTADSAPAGSPETAEAVGLPSAGDYYVRIYETGSASQSQLYMLTINVENQTFSITIPGGAPTTFVPGIENSFDVRISAVNQTIVPDSARVYYHTRFQVLYENALMVHVSGDIWRATIPAMVCGDRPYFYVRAAGTTSGFSTSPPNAPGASNVYIAEIGANVELFADDFETNLGWTVSGNATTGQWVRGNPIGTAAQPEDDVSDPGVNCFFTGQGTAGGAVGEADVDGGSTILTSPVFNLAGTTNPTLSYWRWYDNTRGGAPAADIFEVEISSDNGSTWQDVETVGPASENVGGWIYHEVPVNSLAGVTSTSQMRLRFTASDLATGSIIEAAVDEILVTEFSCTNPPMGCPADWDGDDDVDSDDIVLFFGGFDSGDADFDGDGDTDSDDIVGFFTAWDSGC